MLRRFAAKNTGKTSPRFNLLHKQRNFKTSASGFDGSDYAPAALAMLPPACAVYSLKAVQPNLPTKSVAFTARRAPHAPGADGKGDSSDFCVWGLFFGG
jgi:hypothetical protein